MLGISLVDGGVESLGLAYDAALAHGRVLDAMILPHAPPSPRRCPRWNVDDTL